MMDSAILSVFPNVATHLNHTEDQSLSTQLFPHDTLIAALAISFNRYTIKSPGGESQLSRIAWSVLLGFLAWENCEYWQLISLHLISYCHYLFQLLKHSLFSNVSCNFS